MLLTSWPIVPLRIKLVSDFSVLKTFQLVCLAFFIWMLPESHMFNVNFILLTWIFFYCLPFSFGRIWFISPPFVFFFLLIDLYYR